MDQAQKLKTSSTDAKKTPEEMSSCATGALGGGWEHKPASCDADEGSLSARGEREMLIFGCLAGDIRSLRGISLKQQEHSGIVYYRKLHPVSSAWVCVCVCVQML